MFLSKKVVTYWVARTFSVFGPIFCVWCMDWYYFFFVLFFVNVSGCFDNFICCMNMYMCSCWISVFFYCMVVFVIDNNEYGCSSVKCEGLFCIVHMYFLGCFLFNFHFLVFLPFLSILFLLLSLLIFQGIFLNYVRFLSIIQEEATKSKKTQKLKMWEKLVNRRKVTFSNAIKSKETLIIYKIFLGMDEFPPTKFKTRWNGEIKL